MKRSPSRKGKTDFKRPSVLKHRVSTDVLNDAQNFARRFADADEDGDQLLDFDEFSAMMPDKLRSMFTTEEIRGWFDAADADNSGKLSISEYFLWTLHNAHEIYGEDAIHQVFAKFDPDQSGHLDMREFQHACDETGFGLVAHNIFRTLDPDRNGYISYTELMTSLRNGMPCDESAKRMLTTLIQTYDVERKAEAKRTHETMGHEWVIGGNSVTELPPITHS